MSEPTNASVPPEPTGQPEPVAVEPSGDPEWDAALTEAGGDEPTSETPAPADSGIPAPATPEPTPAEEFIFTTLQNGERELRLATGQTYRGKDDADLLAQVAKAQLHASRTIQELRTPKTPPAASPVTPAPSIEPDQTAIALADLMAPAFGVKNGKELIDRFNGIQQQTQTYAEIAADQRNALAAQQFVASTPDFVPTDANAEKLGQVYAELSRAAGLPEGQFLPYTPENYKLAHDVAKGRGIYEAAPKPTTPPTPIRTNPLPPGGNAPSPSTGKVSPPLAEMESMSMEDLEKLLDEQSAAA